MVAGRVVHLFASNTSSPESRADGIRCTGPTLAAARRNRGGARTRPQRRIVCPRGLWWYWCRGSWDPADMSDLDELRLRSEALADALAADDAIAVNAAILELEPADVRATNRLGPCLMLLGRPKDALDVYETGLQVHPNNRIMRDRVVQARHAVAVASQAPASGRVAKRASKQRGATGWIKSIYHEDGGRSTPDRRPGSAMRVSSRQTASACTARTCGVGRAELADRRPR